MNDLGKTLQVSDSGSSQPHVITSLPVYLFHADTEAQT